MSSCAHVSPIWSAGVDPHVLKVRAVSRDFTPTDWQFELGRHISRIVTDCACERVRIDHASQVLRLDVVEGTLMGGPVHLRTDLCIGKELTAQVATAFALRDLMSGKIIPNTSHDREAAALLRLWAFDARKAGASLREIANLLLGEGDWPGDGEYRKSRARRLVAAGEEMVRLGPEEILL